MPTLQELEEQGLLLLKGIESIKDYAIFSLNPEGIIVTWNQGAESITGYSAKEIIGQPIVRFYNPEIAQQGHIEAILKVAREQTHYTKENWLMRKDGSQFWANEVITPIYDQNNQIIGYTQIVHDLTLRRQAELSLRDSEKRYRLLTTVTSSIVWVRAANGAFITPQPLWEQFTGQSWQEYQQFGWLEAFHPEDREQLRVIWQKAQQTQNFLPKIGRLWSKEHQDYRYVLIRSISFIDEQGQFQEWIGTDADVHEFKQAEEQLKVKTDQLNLALKAAQAGSWQWDADSDQMQWDPAMYPLFGITAEEMQVPILFKNFIKCFVHPTDQDTVSKLLQRAIASEDGYLAEIRILWPDKSEHFIAMRGHIYRDKDYQAIRLIGMAWDVTVSKQLEKERLEALQKAKVIEEQRAQEATEYQRKQAEFIDTICHEIRNPLNGIYGGITLAKDAVNSIERALNGERGCLSTIAENRLQRSLTETRDSLLSAEQCAEQQKSIVDDVLDLSRLDAKQTTLNPIPFNPKEIVQTVASMVTPQISRKQLKLTLFITEANQWIKGDAHHLKQILINLLSNAIKFTYDGNIIIRAKIKAGNTPDTIDLKCSVEDSGIGMTMEELSHLFDRFAQATRHTVSEFGGSGLGLIISKGLVEAMGGTLEVKSEKSQGSRFSFTVRCERLTKEEILKLEKEASDQATQKALLSGPVGKTILVVEDNLMNQKILIKYLEQAGHFCQAANNGAEALEKYQKTNFDIVFMDIEMPVMDGLEATRRIREYEREHFLSVTPIIGLSGNARKPHINAAIEAGMNDYITKPYLKDTIYKAVNTYSSLKTDNPVRRPLKQQRRIERSVTTLETQVHKDSFIPSSSDNQNMFFSPPATATAANVSLEQMPLKIELFKEKIAWMLQVQLPFIGQVTGSELIIELPTDETKRNLEDCQFFLNYIKQLLNKNATIWEIQNSEIIDNRLSIKTNLISQAQAIKTFLSDAGFIDAFNKTIATSYQLII